MSKITPFLWFDTQAEEAVKFYVSIFKQGGEPGPCGWLKDRFGLSWQINPTILGEMLSDRDRAKANRVMDAMLQMQKIEIEVLKKAYEGR